jgi:hypothetical protein
LKDGLQAEKRYLEYISENAAVVAEMILKRFSSNDSENKTDDRGWTIKVWNVACLEVASQIMKRVVRRVGEQPCPIS